MKMLYCPKCHDVRKLQRKQVSCQCGESSGWYKRDNLNAVIAGMAIPIGFQGSSFVEALLDQPEEGMGSVFEAFVIPKECPTIVRM
jgi:hypothetical protein